MKNMSNKTKRLLAIGCLAIVCVVLVAAISSRFQTEPAKDGEMPASSAVANEITLNPDSAKTNDKTDKKDEIVVKPIESVTSQGGTPSQNSNEIIQSNAPEPVKQTPPEKPKAQGDKTNPAKPPEYKPEDTTVTKPSEPKAGEKNEKGQVWFPGFGWVKDEGGGSRGEQAKDMYENGNKIGVMN